MSYVSIITDSYGVVGSYGVLDNTFISLEWLTNEYPTGEDENSVRAQLAVEF